PPHEQMPTVFPGDDATFAPPAGVYCAQDMTAWGSESATNAWGFDWARTADDASKKQWAQLPNADDVPNGAWADPCGTPDLPSVYCLHAYFADCDQVQSNQPRQNACLGWNAIIGKLSVGTAHWLAAQRSVWDRVSGVLSDAAVAPVVAFGKPAVMAWSGLYNIAAPIAKIAAFVANPADAIDDLANKLHEGAVGLSGAVLSQLATTGQFDPSWSWFLTKYAQSAALGIVLMAFMCIHTVVRAARRGTPGELAASIGAYLPLALAAQAFAPAVASLLIIGANALASDVAKAAGTDLADMSTGVYSLGNITVNAVPGGSIVGVFIFLFLLIGAAAVWVGQQLHAIGLPIVGVVVAISFGLWVSPKYRHKAIRPILVFLSIVFSKILLFVLLGVIFALSAAKLRSGDTLNPLGAVERVAFVALAMMVAGLAPWALLKWVPFLPTASDSADFGSGPPISAAVIGGAGTGAMYLHSARRGRAGAETPRAPLASNTHNGTGPGAGQGASPVLGGASGSGAGRGPVEQAWAAKHANPTTAAAGQGPTVGAATTAGRGSGAAAAPAAKAGASAGAGAATAGVSFAAQMAAVAMTKGKTAAENHPHRAEDTKDDE
uniref:hypothetical protein n=1 Tax=Aldersonia kunmingensis TaxID=408066 RepID=UPI00082D73C1